MMEMKDYMGTSLRATKFSGNLLSGQLLTSLPSRGDTFIHQGSQHETDFSFAECGIAPKCIDITDGASGAQYSKKF